MAAHSRSFTSRIAIVALAMLAMMPPLGSAATAQPAPSGLAVPQAEALLALIRSALVALDHANKTGNYSVLREFGGPGLQANSSGQLSNMFAPLRNGGADLLPTLIATPQLTQSPVIGPQGHLQLIGHFPTRPQQIAFQIVYQPVNGQWRLFGLNVTLQQVDAATVAPVAAPSAVSTAPAQPQPPAKATGAAGEKATKAEPQSGAKSK